MRPLDAFAILLSREECFELLGVDAVGDGFFGLTRGVFKREALPARKALCRCVPDTNSNVSNELQAQPRKNILIPAIK